MLHSGSCWGDMGHLDLWGLCLLGRPNPIWVSGVRFWDRRVGVSVRATWPIKRRFSRGTF